MGGRCGGKEGGIVEPLPDRKPTPPPPPPPLPFRWATGSASPTASTGKAPVSEIFINSNFDSG